jgi:CheY-like chemotaxis protein
LPRVARILIIDDDPAVSVTLARMLGLDGHSVIRVETAHDGLTRSHDDPPDAIILDMRMPAMGGLEFLRRLRADDRLRHLPVGIITGDYFLGDDILAELSALGASVRYKPVWIDDLSALTRSLLAGRDAGAPAEPAQ